MDVIALLLFIAVIIIAFVRKINVGVLAMAAGIIAVRIFGLKDNDLIGGVSSSMFTTLVGITLLFAAIHETGALDMLAYKIVGLAGKKLWVIPIAVYIAGFIVAGVGPGAIPALAIIPAIGVSIAVRTGYNPIMLGLIGEAGLMAGRMTPITPEAAIITAAAESAGVSNVMVTVLACQTLVTVVYSILLYIIFKGYKVKALPETADKKLSEMKFSKKQVIALLGIVVMLALIVFADVNIGLAAFFVATCLLLFGISSENCLKQIPWGTIIMVLGVGALLDVVNSVGGIDLMRNGLEKVMSPLTATPLMGLSAGLLSLVSSALGVVYPTMMPMAPGIAATLGGGLNPAAMMAAVGAGGSLAGISPLSTGGSLMLAAMGTNTEDFTKEKQNKTFILLFALAGLALLCTVVVSGIAYNLIANLLG